MMVSLQDDSRTVTSSSRIRRGAWRRREGEENIVIIFMIINCLSFSYGPHETTRIHGLCVMKPLDLLSALFLTMICFQDVHGVIDDRGGEIVSKNGC